MPTPYEYTYGDVKFYDLAGTLVLDTQASAYALYLVEDDEPSPDPKWVRVDVPGADGSVDLSRALTGQVQYKTREITLRFAGSQATHALALGVVRTLRKLLHGQRLRIQTMLTAQVSGYYVADVECDGTADPAGIVEMTVTATCDPFIRTGTQTLTLPQTAGTSYSAYPTNDTTAGLVAGAGSIVGSAFYSAGAGYGATPMYATTGRLWYACGTDADHANVFDLTRMTVVGTKNGTYTYSSDVVASGDAVSLGDADTTDTKRIYVSPYARRGASVKDSKTVGIPFLSGFESPKSSINTLGIYLSGTIDSVSSPSISVYKEDGVTRVDGNGLPTGMAEASATTTMDVTLAAGDYAGTLVAHATVSCDNVLEMLAVQFGGIKASGLLVQFVACKGSAYLPAAWEPPSVGYVDVDFGGTFCRSTTNGDKATIAPFAVTTTHNCRLDATGYRAADETTPYTTAGSIGGWLPQDAKRICMTAVNAYGEECPVALVESSSHAIGTVTGSNTTMRSTPSITSLHGAYVSIDGRSAMVPGGTVELQALTIPGGSFTVAYAMVGNGAGTLTWEGGVL